MPDGDKSYLKQIVVAVVIALLAGGTAPWWWTAIFHGCGGGGSGGGGGATPSFSIPCADPAISLSQGSGPSGTHVRVSGSGFPSGESVELRFHTEALPPARTDAKGTFEDEIVVPGTFDAFAGQQFEITATTTPTVCSDSAPFSLTG